MNLALMIESPLLPALLQERRRRPLCEVSRRFRHRWRYAMSFELDAFTRRLRLP
jgi:hypothetical protein